MHIDDFKQQLPDIDEAETRDWVDSFDQVLDQEGENRARFLMFKLLKRARQRHVGLPSLTQTRYINTISPEQEPWFPGDEELERRIRRLIRWNAVAMVLRANNKYAGIGGHLATYASAASLYEVGFNHFFRGKDHPGGGDQVFFQGHAAPGIYARAFLEGRFTEEHLDHFRRETGGKGLSSYPHPRLMPDFWEFPTVSMGLGPLAAVYQARFNRYLQNRGIRDTSEQRVWAFLGDGEMDEPESLSGISLAARDGLDNLTFVINCNLQRLDGPVRGNGKIIQELEGQFRGAGWNVIKVVWGREWDELLARDTDGVLVEKMSSTLDGEFQKMSVSTGALRARALLRPRRPADQDGRAPLGRPAAQAPPRRPRLPQGLRGLPRRDPVHGRPDGDPRQDRQGLDARPGRRGPQHHPPGEEAQRGSSCGSSATASSCRSPTPRSRTRRTSTRVPDSDEVKYMLERRAALGGPLPRRVVRSQPLPIPSADVDKEFDTGSPTAVSTTMVFTRLLRNLIRDPQLGKRIVPIIPDEARTFGMDPLFKEVGIYAAKGQRYDPVDSNLVLSYREATDGQVLEEGINEAGSMASFQAAGTSYATHGEPMIPFYIFYSMFGFQRTGDQAWAFGDQRGRGFMMGATAGRTTLTGEGLQHDDGHTQVLASTVPVIKAYDPAFAYELATIVRDGVTRMYHDGEDVYYYVTVYNENYPQPAKAEGVDEGIIKGLYRFAAAQDLPDAKGRVRLVGSGSILQQVLAARDLLAERFGIVSEIYSATSFQQLRHEALQVERWNRLHPDQKPRVPYVTQVLGHDDAPVIVATDWLKTLPDLIAPWAPQPYIVLGTDGFGRSDTRDALRSHFEIDPPNIAAAALAGLARCGGYDPAAAAAAIRELGLDPDAPDPLTA